MTDRAGMPLEWRTPYCTVCGQQPGTFMNPRWDMIFKTHEYYPEGRPLKCPGSLRKVPE